MKFEFKNLGPIKQGELELGDLTVICGSNNTGKTYLAYTLYGFLRYLQGSGFIRSHYRENEHFLITKQFVRELVSRKEASVRIDINELLHHEEWLMQKIKAGFEEYLPEAFASEEDYFKQTKVTWIPGISDKRKRIETMLENMKNTEVWKGITATFNNKILSFTLVPDVKDSFIINSEDFIRTAIINYFTNNIVLPYVNRPFILTSERLGISLFYKDLDANRDALVTAIQNLGKGKRGRFGFILDALNEQSKYAKPIRDEIEFVRNLEEIKKRKSNFSKKSGKKLCDIIEEILGGRYKVTKSDIRLISNTKNKNNKYNVPLHVSSASSRELADLYFYFKHVAMRDDLVVLDEPESHLTPHNIIRLAQLLCEGVRAGLKIVITTHSELILKEINNHIMVSKLSTNSKKRINKIYRKSEGLDSSKVRAYYCGSGEVHSCDINNWGIVIPQFDDAHADLNTRAVELARIVGGK